MIWVLRDFDLLSVFLRAITLALEILALGGVAFLLMVAVPARASEAVWRICWQGIRWAAFGLILTEICYIAINTAILMAGSSLPFRKLVFASYFVAGTIAAAAALAIWICAHKANRGAALLAVFPSVTLLVATVSTSHSVSRMDHRVVLTLCTAAHHLGAAVWIGSLFYLLISMKLVGQNDASGNDHEARRLLQRFSPMAIVGASLLLLGGVGMAWFYVGFGGKSFGGLYGTAYGAMLLSKAYLFLMILALGAGNYFLVRRIATAPGALLTRLRRFGEAEIGFAFTAILAAASMTSQPPAIDLRQDWVSPAQIAARLRPEIPRLTSPAFAALRPSGSLIDGLKAAEFGSDNTENDANDRAWSEYNHHWAGLVVLAAGLFALLSRLPGAQWARNWPLAFAGLAVFILLRADPENWPLGPRSFWGSFASPDVLQHRFYALLILGFAGFEWGVQTGRLHAQWMKLVFPVLCALGGAALMTHNHGIGNVGEELLAEISHTAIALLGVTAGCSRWLELRLAAPKDARRAAYAWPVCLVLVGLVLLNYRES